MKKYISFVLVAVFALGALSVSAQETSTTRGEMEKRPNLEKREMLRKELEQKREVFNKELKIKREEFRKATRERKEQFSENAKRMIGERFDQAMRNIARMQVRVDEVIEKAKANGKNTETAEAYLKESQAKLSEAQKKIEQIKTLIPAQGAEVSAETFESIKMKAREAKDLLKESHQALVSAIRDLRGMIGEVQKRENKEE